ncbi:LuxR C-terminal-related transcriptional regulator [Nocardioides humi]|uniref:HTH luxR-type domain-containing protein n=1 Tax=Nocardioides humi TaxID=449461 RepID=A0ABN2B365_9ACTN|nr:LuxR C-terminal-related transcriptional regulator [Nocardioides humi]
MTATADSPDLARSDAADLVAALSAREADVLALLANGYSNRGIGAALALSERTVEAYLTTIFQKFRIEHAPGTNRRVLAALVYLDYLDGSLGV